MAQRSNITKTCTYLTINIDRTQQFYMLTKFHKNTQNPTGRPIVSGRRVPLRKFPDLWATLFAPIIPLSKSYIRDSIHLINILQELQVPHSVLLCIINVTTLYTNTLHNEGISSIKEMLDTHRQPLDLPHCSYIVELLTIFLANNHFEINRVFYHQVSGTVMCTKLASSYANLFMSKFEDKYVYTYPRQPKLWERFIDNIFLTWDHGLESL